MNSLKTLFRSALVGVGAFITSAVAVAAGEAAGSEAIAWLVVAVGWACWAGFSWVKRGERLKAGLMGFLALCFLTNGIESSETVAELKEARAKVVDVNAAARASRVVAQAAEKVARDTAEQQEREAAKRAEHQRRQQAAAARAESDRQYVALNHCQEELSKRSKYPSEVEFPWLDWNYKENGRRAIFISKAKLMNGFGAKIPHTFKCVYDVGDPKRMVLQDFQMWEG